MPLPDAPQSRRHQLNISLNDEQWQKINAHAEAHSRTPVDYVRRVALGQIPVFRTSFNQGSSV